MVHAEIEWKKASQIVHKLEKHMVSLNLTHNSNHSRLNRIQHLFPNFR